MGPKAKSLEPPSGFFLPGLLMLTASSPSYGSKNLSPFCIWCLSLPAGLDSPALVSCSFCQPLSVPWPAPSLTVPILVCLHHTCVVRVVMHSVMICLTDMENEVREMTRLTWGVNGEAGVKSNSRDNQVPLGLSWHLLTEGWWRPRSRCLGLTFWGKVPPWQKDWAV